MITVALDEFRYIILPQLGPVYPTSGKLLKPLIVQFIHNQKSIFITKIQKGLTVGIMGGAHMVEPKLLEQFEPFLDGTGIGCCTQGAQGMMVGNALEQHLLTIESESESG